MIIRFPRKRKKDSFGEGLHSPFPPQFPSSPPPLLLFLVKRLAFAYIGKGKGEREIVRAFPS